MLTFSFAGLADLGLVGIVHVLSGFSHLRLIAIGIFAAFGVFSVATLSILSFTSLGMVTLASLGVFRFVASRRALSGFALIATSIYLATLTFLIGGILCALTCLSNLGCVS